MKRAIIKKLDDELLISQKELQVDIPKAILTAREDGDLKENFASCLGALEIIKDGWETEAIPEAVNQNIEKISFFAKIFKINR